MGRSSFVDGLRHLIFPSLCFACRRHEPLRNEHLCLSCLKSLPFVSSWQDSVAALEGKEFFPDGVYYFYSLFYYSKESYVAEMIHRIKYNGQYRIANYLGMLLGKKLLKEDWQGYTIVPVPIHKKRRINRGFNQAEEIAHGIGSVLTIPCSLGYLIRTSHESSQTGKDKHERSAVLNSSFDIDKTISVTDKILLVDDVITTGSTINACMKALQKDVKTKIAVVSLGVSI